MSAAPETTQDDALPTTAWLLAEAVKKVEAVGKDRETDQGPRYRYRGIEDVMNALHPILSELGLTLHVDTVEYELDWRVASNNKERRTATLCIRCGITGPDGTVLRLGSWWGEGDAYDDKATNKAYSAALKLMLLHVFHVPTEDMTDTEAGPNGSDEEELPLATADQVKAVKALVQKLDDKGKAAWAELNEAKRYREEWQRKALTEPTAQAALNWLVGQVAAAEAEQQNGTEAEEAESDAAQEAEQRAQAELIVDEEPF